MTSGRIALASCLLLLASVAPAAAGGNAHFVLGSRALDEDLWSPLDEQGVLGATVDFGGDGWPVRLAAGAMFSGRDERAGPGPLGLTGPGSVTLTVAEFGFGVMKVWEAGGHVHPYVGGGACLVRASAEREVSGLSATDHANSGGLYAHAGLYWRLGPGFDIGFEARALGGTDIDIFGADGDVDYVQAGLVIGWAWR